MAWVWISVCRGTVGQRLLLSVEKHVMSVAEEVSFRLLQSPCIWDQCFLLTHYIFREIVHQTPASVLHTARFKLLALDYMRHHCTVVYNFSLVTLTRTVGDIQLMKCGICIFSMNIISMIPVYDTFVHLCSHNQQHYDLHLSNCFFHSDVVLPPVIPYALVPLGVVHY